MKSHSLWLLAALAFPCVAPADTLKKIADSGKIVMGVRESGPPLSYSVGPGQYGGYHVEICEQVIRALKRRLGVAELAVQYMPVTSQNRIPLVQNGTVDIECGTTTNNEARQKEVAFALTTYLTEVRIATRAESPIRSVAHLNGKTVATTTGSTAVKTLRQHKRAVGMDFKEVYGKDYGETFLMLESGRVDAMVTDDNILAGLIALSKEPAAFRITGETLSVEPIAIMLRKDDPAFKKAVDDQIAGMMKGGEITRLYDKWFMQPIVPKNTSLGLPMGAALKQLIATPNDKPAEAFQEARK